MFLYLTNKSDTIASLPYFCIFPFDDMKLGELT